MKEAKEKNLIESIETMYYQMVAQNAAISNIKNHLERIEGKIDRMAKLQLDEYYGVAFPDGLSDDIMYTLCEQTRQCYAGKELDKYGRTEM